MEPLMILALGVTLILTGLACAYVAMSMVKKNSEMAVVLNYSCVDSLWGEYMWIGILIGLFLSILLVKNWGKKFENQKNLGG
ncbi:MAG: hypothetical protein Ct9H90mP19_0160 [Gammaproteobacteria bacterium]|nr:MAG: hypothetical protein Ct9H90mP19_0160 [Gammaproteobacteria bacterium]